MGFVDENLIAGEKVLYRAHLHWVVYAPAIVSSLLFVVSLGMMLIITEPVPVCGLLNAMWVFLAIGTFVTAVIQRKTSEFAVTNRRVLIKTGFIHRHSLDLFHQKVEAISVDQDLGSRILGCGIITVTGSGGTKERFTDIDNPLEFRRQIQMAMGD